ncbi:Short-chain dehydrogenase [Amycolatopsis arida]|uniref:Short-chain dehydrogenase n=1 Tax=Amycolatopsis arida TaxID=587909 RepID=A0A1I5M277_9PSEU|nr:SDR family NAD(P)-dependent oxidoreductase [Amycolatopsis arida]TDX93939.1 short-subunit dehydrogenase [Amycolatopsis arida]SFP03652.1 Short-chain dehydrogenase [Amycolatopsis arida]
MTRRSFGAAAVVTGAGSGIGRAFAAELARRGGRVVCADLDPTTAKETAALAEAAGGRGLAVECDVSVEAQMWDLCETAERWFGEPATLVINNAGIGAGGRVVGETPLPDWRRTLDVNLWGVIHGCHVFVPWLREHGGGIVNVASAAGFVHPPRMAAYNVAKAGVLALSRTLAAELAGTGVTVTVLCPTFVRTNIVSGERIDARAARAASVLMRLTGAAPERIVTAALDAHDRGRLHVVPRADARLLWWLGRLSPTAVPRAAGLLGRLLPPPDPA